MPFRTRDAGESGAVLVHVAFAFIALLAFTTFVVDYGVFWTARRQAQNSADAGALAGAISAAYDGTTDFSDSGPVKQNAWNATQANIVFGQAPDVNITSDITVPYTCPPPWTGDDCIRVDVYRNAARGNALPVFFGALVGLSDQGIRATATAMIASGNASDCLKPWGVIDKWQEIFPTPTDWDTTKTFDKYDKQGELDPDESPPDYYQAPTESDPGTGFRPYNPDGSFSVDYGLELSLKVGDQTDFDYATGWFSALRLDPDCSGGNCYREAIKGCVGITYKIGDELPIDTEPGEKVGPTMHGVEDDVDSLVNQDPTAYWDDGAFCVKRVSTGPCILNSPRIVAIPLVNPDIMADVQKGGRTSVPIANILAFFVEEYDNSEKTVVGRLVTTKGMLVAGGPSVGDSSFMKTIMLVR